MRQTLVPPEISQLIGACGLTRQAIVRVLISLHDELPQHYGRFRHLRYPDDERLFFFFVAVADDGGMHTFTFHIDDATSPAHLIVVDLEHQAR